MGPSSAALNCTFAQTQIHGVLLEEGGLEREHLSLKLLATIFKALTQLHGTPVVHYGLLVFVHVLKVLLGCKGEIVLFKLIF
jgi:hypothetical protein